MNNDADLAELDMDEPISVLEPAADETPEDVRFIDSLATFRIAGKPLHPFSSGRRALAQRLGMSYGKLKPTDVEKETFTGDDGEELINFSYPGLVDDVIIVTFICSMEKREATEAKWKGRVQLLEDAYDWADKVGLVYPSEMFQRALAMVSRLLSNETDAAPVPGDGSGKRPA